MPRIHTYRCNEGLNPRPKAVTTSLSGCLSNKIVHLMQSTKEGKYIKASIFFNEDTECESGVLGVYGPPNSGIYIPNKRTKSIIFFW